MYNKNNLKENMHNKIFKLISKTVRKYTIALKKIFQNITIPSLNCINCFNVSIIDKKME